MVVALAGRRPGGRSAELGRYVACDCGPIAEEIGGRVSTSKPRTSLSSLPDGAALPGVWEASGRPAFFLFFRLSPPCSDRSPVEIRPVELVAWQGHCQAAPHRR